MCFWGLIVASKRGRNTFSSILAKLGINFFDLKISLQDKMSKFNPSSCMWHKHFTVCLLIENSWLRSVIIQNPIMLQLVLTKSWALGSSISCWASGPYAGWTTLLGSPTRSQSGRKLTDGARHVGICSPPAPRPLPETDNKPQEETGCFLIKQKWLVVTAQWTDMATLFPSFSKVLFTAYSKASLRWAALPVRVRHIYIYLIPNDSNLSFFLKSFFCSPPWLFTYTYACQTWQAKTRANKFCM